MFAGFKQERIVVKDAEINVLTGGSGPPLLLLHGYPQTHVIWHAVTPLLQDYFTLVIPDLRGYGDSKGPAPDPEHSNYSKRAMARDMVGVMDTLGHKRFLLCGHDRGGRVAYRLTLDQAARVQRLALLDIVPTIVVWEQMDFAAALQTYHWPFLAQPAPVPEHLIGADPDFYIEHLLGRWAGDRAALDPQAVSCYVEHFRRPSVIEATCEDYRAGATVDMEDDRADRIAGRRITCPTLLIWGRDYLEHPPLAAWRDWAEDLSEVALNCGHFIAEEEPTACASALREHFLR